MAKTPLQRASQFSGHHVVEFKTSFLVLVALAILMAATIGFSYVDLPGGLVVNNIVAMLIACTKAGLVMWYFMGLKWSSALTRLWAFAGFVVFSLMFIILVDYNSRSFEVAPSWDGRPESATPRVVDPAAANAPVDPVDAGFRPRG